MRAGVASRVSVVFLAACAAKCVTWTEGKLKRHITNWLCVCVCALVVVVVGVGIVLYFYRNSVMFLLCSCCVSAMFLFRESHEAG